MNRKIIKTRTVAVLLLPFCLCGFSFGAEVDVSKLPPAAAKKIVFQDDIKPMLENSCLRCHGAEKPKSKFSLITREVALEGGKNGVAIFPGDSAKSPLIHYVAGLVEGMEMPPKEKNEPLSQGQIALLRAWIDQGAEWGAMKPAQPNYSVSPTLRWTSVSGDKQKFREQFWMKEGLTAGVENFHLHENLTNNATVALDGRAFPVDEDFRVTLRYDRPDFGFIHGGFEHYQKYYDNSGGYYPFAQPLFSLDRDLALNIGKAWIDFGLTIPDRPKVVFGYEYLFKEGTKSTMQWGAVKTTTAPVLPATSIEKNIYPAFKDIDEQTHILKLDVTHEVRGVGFEDNLRTEFYDLKTHRESALSLTQGQLTPTRFTLIDEAHNEFRIANTFRLEKEIRENWFVSGGYLYSKADADAAFRQNTVHATGIPVSGDFWNSQSIILSQDAHVFNGNIRFGPWKDLTISGGIQSEWMHQEGVGRVSIDTGNPATFLLIQPATLDANLDKQNLQETIALRFSGIPYTSLFSDARLEQESFGTFENQIGGGYDFMRDTDATLQGYDYRFGFYSSPLPKISFGGHYRNRHKQTEYDNRVDLLNGGMGDSYPAFIRERTIRTDEIEAKITVRPVNWLRSTFSFQIVDTDFDSDTDAVAGISSGGPLRAGNFNANVYGMNLVLTPVPRWYFSGTFNYYDSRATSEHNDLSSVVPYRGDIYTILTSSTYMLNTNTDLTASYALSKAGYGQNNFAGGLPVGIDYASHGVQVGMRKRFKNVTTNLQYGYYHYSEPTSGSFNDFSAHVIFATLTFRWP